MHKCPCLVAHVYILMASTLSTQYKKFWIDMILHEERQRFCVEDRLWGVVAWRNTYSSSCLQVQVTAYSQWCILVVANWLLEVSRLLKQIVFERAVSIWCSYLPCDVCKYCTNFDVKGGSWWYLKLKQIVPPILTVLSNARPLALERVDWLTFALRNSLSDIFDNLIMYYIVVGILYDTLE